jgi:hypothetical protein
MKHKPNTALSLFRRIRLRAKPDWRPEPHNPDTSLSGPQTCPTNGDQLNPLGELICAG